MLAVIRKRAVTILIAYDILLNAWLGGEPYQTVSCRIGLSIELGGWASRVPWPRWWITHCLNAVYSATV